MSAADMAPMIFDLDDRDTPVACRDGLLHHLRCASVVLYLDEGGGFAVSLIGGMTAYMPAML